MDISHPLLKHWQSSFNASMFCHKEEVLDKPTKYSISKEEVVSLCFKSQQSKNHTSYSSVYKRSLSLKARETRLILGFTASSMVLPPKVNCWRTLSSSSK